MRSQMLPGGHPSTCLPACVCSCRPLRPATPYVFWLAPCHATDSTFTRCRYCPSRFSTARRPSIIWHIRCWSFPFTRWTPHHSSHSTRSSSYCSLVCPCHRLREQIHLASRLRPGDLNQVIPRQIGSPRRCNQARDSCIGTISKLLQDLLRRTKNNAAITVYY